MPGTRAVLNEIVFCGVSFAFDLRNRYRVIARVDDVRSQDFGPLPIADAMTLIDRFVSRFISSEVSIERVGRITTEHGYVIIVDLRRGENTLLVSFELARD